MSGNACPSEEEDRRGGRVGRKRQLDRRVDRVGRQRQHKPNFSSFLVRFSTSVFLRACQTPAHQSRPRRPAIDAHLHRGTTVRPKKESRHLSRDQTRVGKEGRTKGKASERGKDERGRRGREEKLGTWLRSLWFFRRSCIWRRTSCSILVGSAVASADSTLIMLLIFTCQPSCRQSVAQQLIFQPAFMSG